MRRWWLKRTGLVIIVCGIIFALTRSHELIFLGLNEKIEILKYWVEKLGIWAPLAYILVFILRPLAFLPATPVAILGGLLFGGTFGTIYVLMGVMCSGACEFLFVRHFAEEKTKRFLKERSQAVNRIITRHGFLTVLLVRLIPNVAFDLQNCGLALMPIKFTHYFYGTLLGCLPASIFYTSFGNLVLDWFVPWRIAFVVFFGLSLCFICIFLKREYALKT
jgi:uncharacterized membrane protein YdjX (TVP38/TMEM64 family)